MSRKGMPNDIAKKCKPKQHQVVAFRKNNKIMALQWKDKWLVTMLSSVFNAECEVEEHILSNGNSATIPKPVVILQYTKYMGGVDKADHYCGSCTFLRKTAKWWRKMFFLIFEVTSTALFYTLEGRNKD